MPERKTIVPRRRVSANSIWSSPELDQGRQEWPDGQGERNQEREPVGLGVVADECRGREELDDEGVDVVEDLERDPDDEQVAACLEQSRDAPHVQAQGNASAGAPEQQEGERGRGGEFATDEGPDTGVVERQQGRDSAEEQGPQHFEAGDLADPQLALEEGAVDHDHRVDHDPDRHRAEHVRQVGKVREEVGGGDQGQRQDGAGTEAPGQYGAVGLARIAHQTGASARGRAPPRGSSRRGALARTLPCSSGRMSRASMIPRPEGDDQTGRTGCRRR